VAPSYKVRLGIHFAAILANLSRDTRPL